jgi:oxaloacetate decarboxylase gamma subunit
MTSTLDPLVTEGVQLMLVGMGTVFVFLTMLVFAVRVMSAMILKYAPQAQSDMSKTSPSAVPAAHVAAVAAALKKHRSS